MNGRTTAELSRIASHQYSDDFRVAQAVFSRGARMAEAIDERVRRETAGRRRFRDIARGLMAWCASQERAVTVDDIERIAASTTGVQVRDIIDAWLAPRGAAPSGRPRP
jgi:predicted metalloprotease with PDZ domain